MLAFNRVITLIAAISTAPVVLADQTPSLDDLRTIIQERASSIAQGKSIGFAYTVHRNVHPRIPLANLPDRIAREASVRKYRKEAFVRKGGLRALAADRLGDSERPPLDVITWNGEVLMQYFPSRGTGQIDFRDNPISHIDDLFFRLQGPFAWEFLPVDIDTAGDCLQGKYHPQVDLRQLLAQDGLRVLDETEVLDDSTCVVIANDMGPFLWLDADRGLVVKQFIQPATDLPGVERIHYYNERFVQVSSDLWAVERGFMLLRGPGIDYEHVTVQDYLCQVTVSFEDIRLNEPIEDSAFDIAFPPGTQVALPEDDFGRRRVTTKGFLP